MTEEADIIRAKDWVILKRGTHMQLFQLSNKPRLNINSFQFDLKPILGKPYWSTFRVELKPKGKSVYSLKYCDPNESIDCTSILENETSGTDNRHIQDDNNAQSLTKDEILEMKNSGVSSQNILQQLVKNSKTFSLKTEFAQEKWLQKKSNKYKYTGYMQILKPTIRLLSEVYLKPVEWSKRLLGLRTDTLSQIMTAVNLHPEGKYIVYENNCEGIVVASILNLLNSNGKLLNIITPDYPFSKRRAFSAMKFSYEKRSRIVDIRLSSFCKYLNMKTNSEDTPITNCIDNLSNDVKSIQETPIVKNEPGSRMSWEQDECEDFSADSPLTNCIDLSKDVKSLQETPVVKHESRSHISWEFSREFPTNDINSKRQAECVDFSADTPFTNCIDLSKDVKSIQETPIVKDEPESHMSWEFSRESSPNDTNLKRQAECAYFSSHKRTTQQEIADQEIRDLVASKADGLILVCKEIPNKLLIEMLQFLAPSRSFVVYYQFHEPLAKLYMELKQRHDVINLRLFENFLRPYQILPDRTHPVITMSDTGGYLLTGIFVTNLKCETIQ